MISVNELIALLALIAKFQMRVTELENENMMLLKALDEAKPDPVPSEPVKAD